MTENETFPLNILQPLKFTKGHFHIETKEIVNIYTYLFLDNLFSMTSSLQKLKVL